MQAMAFLIRLAGMATLVLFAYAASADVLNVEFKFTPFTGDLKADHVESVAGKTKVFINNIPVTEREIEKKELPVLFEAREIAPAVWVPVDSMGSVVRKGKNILRIEFEPDQDIPYHGQFSWAQVTDQTTAKSEPGSYQATNQSGEGKEEKEGSGKMVFQREFIADFAADRPWHHYPVVSALTAEDKHNLASLVASRAEAFKPKFSEVYRLLEGKSQGIDVAGVRKSKCLDKAYAAGVRIIPPSAEEIEFAFTGNPEVVLQRQGAPLFKFDPKDLERIKGDEMQMCAAVVLSLVYPQSLIVVRKPDGNWEVVD